MNADLRDQLARINRVIGQLQRDAARLMEQPPMPENRVRVDVLHTAISAAVSYREDLRAGEAVTPAEILGISRGFAMDASERAQADPNDSELSGARRARWRAVFVFAEAFGLDPFGRTQEQAEAEEARRWQPARPVNDEGPRCAGVTKSGQPCQAKPCHGTAFCHQHQDQAAEPVEQDQAPAIAAEPVDPEADFDAEVDRWLAEAERGRD